jgi:hypothetical protein
MTAPAATPWPQRTLRWCELSLKDLGQTQGSLRLSFLMEMAIKIAKATLAILIYIPTCIAQKIAIGLNLIPSSYPEPAITPRPSTPAPLPDSLEKKPKASPGLPLAFTDEPKTSPAEDGAKSPIKAQAVKGGPSNLPQPLQAADDEPSPLPPSSAAGADIHVPASEDLSPLPRAEVVSEATSSVQAPANTVFSEPGAASVAIVVDFSTWSRVAVDAEGNCLFHSINLWLEHLPQDHLRSLGINPVPDHVNLRSMCVQYLSEHLEEDQVSSKIDQAIESYNASKDQSLQAQIQNLTATIASEDLGFNAEDKRLMQVEKAALEGTLASKQEHFKTPSEYLEAAAQNRFFAGFPELYAASKLFQINIFIARNTPRGFSTEYDPPFFFDQEAPQNAPCIYIVNEAKHFDPLLPPA